MNIPCGMINVNDMHQRIQSRISGTLLLQYQTRSFDLLQEYTEIINTPITIYFITDNTQPDPNQIQLDKLVERYMTCVQETVPTVELDAVLNSTEKSYIHRTSIEPDTDDTCDSCGSIDIITVEGHVTCKECSTVYESYSFGTSYMDTTRVNVSHRNTTNYRKNNFLNTLHRYEGKCVSSIPNVVIQQVIKRLQISGLIPPFDVESLDILYIYQKYIHIEPHHVYTALQQTHNTKYDEDTTCIHRMLTACPEKNITEYIPSVMVDFEIFDREFIRKFGTRKHFINSQLLLMKLLNKHGHKATIKEFYPLRYSDKIDVMNEDYNSVINIHVV